MNNGFKVPGSIYAEKIIRLRADGFANVIPILEDEDEIGPFAQSGLDFQVGLRQKISKKARTQAEIRASDIRFGMDVDAMHRAARQIADAPNLTLVMFHAMQSVDTANPQVYLDGFRASMQLYAELAQAHPSL